GRGDAGAGPVWETRLDSTEERREPDARNRQRLPLLQDRDARDTGRHRPFVRCRSRLPRHQPESADAHPDHPEGPHRLLGSDHRQARRPAGGDVPDRRPPGPGRGSRSIGMAPGHQRRSGRRTERRSPALPSPGGASDGMATGLMKQAARMKIQVPGNQSMVALLGQRDELLKLVESAFDAQILVRGNEITITGEQRDTDKVAFLFEEMLAILQQGHTLTAESVAKTIDMVKENSARPSQVFGDVVLTTRGRTLGPKTLGQKRYVDAIRRSTLTFAIGPAGTGKTYLAVAAAVRALNDRDVSRIILTRPAVEAGERL